METLNLTLNIILITILIVSFYFSRVEKKQRKFFLEEIKKNQIKREEYLEHLKNDEIKRRGYLEELKKLLNK